MTAAIWSSGSTFSFHSRAMAALFHTEEILTWAEMRRPRRPTWSEDVGRPLAVPQICCMSSVSFSALCLWTWKGRCDSCIFKCSDLLRGASFLIPLPFSATLYKLCCKEKIHLLKADLVCALGSLLVTVAAGWGRASVGFCHGMFWHWVVGGFSHLLCSVTQQGGWLVASRGDCRLDRAVSLVLSKAGVYFRCC